jgi:hypothetical protein
MEQKILKSGVKVGSQLDEHALAKCPGTPRTADAAGIDVLRQLYVHTIGRVLQQRTMYGQMEVDAHTTLVLRDREGAPPGDCRPRGYRYVVARRIPDVV